MQQIEDKSEEIVLEGEVELNVNGYQQFKNMQAAHSFCQAFNIYNYNLRTAQDGTVVIQYDKGANL